MCPMVADVEREEKTNFSDKRNSLSFTNYPTYLLKPYPPITYLLKPYPPNTYLLKPYPPII